MPYPTLRGSTSGYMTTSGYSLNISFPANVVDGDLLIIGISRDGSSTASAPAAYTLLANPTGVSTNRHPVWYGVRRNGESSVTISWGASELGSWYCIAINGGTWEGIPAIASAYGTTANPNAPAVTAPWGIDDNLFLALHGWDYNRTSSSSPANYSLRTYQTGSNTGSAGHRTHYRNYHSASDDPGQITISASDQWITHTLVIKPLSSPLKHNSKVNVDGSYYSIEEVYINYYGYWKRSAAVFVNVDGGYYIETNEQTLQPTIHSVDYYDDEGSYNVTFSVQNNDATASLIYVSVSGIMTETVVGVASYGQSVTVNVSGSSPITAYAKAKGVNKPISEIVSYNIL